MEVIGHIIVIDPESILLVNGEFLPKGHYQVVTDACDCLDSDQEQIQRMIDGDYEEEE